MFGLSLFLQIVVCLKRSFMVDEINGLFIQFGKYWIWWINLIYKLSWTFYFLALTIFPVRLFSCYSSSNFTISRSKLSGFSLTPYRITNSPLRSIKNLVQLNRILVPIKPLPFFKFCKYKNTSSLFAFSLPSKIMKSGLNLLAMLHCSSSPFKGSCQPKVFVGTPRMTKPLSLYFCWSVFSCS